jgi:protein-tyrosine phosphatase
VIDLHSHLLPAVDDGSRSVAQSVKVMTEQVARGVTDICLTPHVRAGDLAKAPPESHEAAYAALQAAAPPLPRLHRG